MSDSPTTWGSVIPSRRKVLISGAVHIKAYQLCHDALPAQASLAIVPDPCQNSSNKSQGQYVYNRRKGVMREDQKCMMFLRAGRRVRGQLT